MAQTWKKRVQKIGASRAIILPAEAFKVTGWDDLEIIELMAKPGMLMAKGTGEKAIMHTLAPGEKRKRGRPSMKDVFGMGTGPGPKFHRPDSPVYQNRIVAEPAVEPTVDLDQTSVDDDLASLLADE